MKNYLIPVLAVIIIGAVVLIYSCTEKKPAKFGPSEVKNLDWVKTAVIYEVNIRQYTKEGTFNAFAAHLPRLKSMGVDILWLMPIHPIGEKNRKEPLGSYYSVKDYTAVNPAFGSMEDFKNMVKQVHELGMKLIIDWVPNHSAWDHAFVTEHPEYYKKDSTGKMISPFDWTDVVQFDYRNKELRNWMVENLKFWLKEADIDGYRCDVAGMVPTDFWDSARVELDKVKPVFMLAEADKPELHLKAFDASYDWRLHHIMNDIAKGKKNANQIAKHIDSIKNVYPEGSILMQFTSNHDENSWNGTEFERLGKGAQAFAVVAATVPGMPLIYNGQESAFDRRLKFFEKDSINWGNFEYTEFYEKLFKLKETNEALWSGVSGGTFDRINTNTDKEVIAYVREKGENKVFVIANLSNKAQDVKFKDKDFKGNYRNIFTNAEMELKKDNKINLQAWEYLVLEKIK